MSSNLRQRKMSAARTRTLMLIGFAVPFLVLVGAVAIELGLGVEAVLRRASWLAPVLCALAWMAGDWMRSGGKSPVTRSARLIAAMLFGYLYSLLVAAFLMWVFIELSLPIY